jgi:hypothetical protein
VLRDCLSDTIRLTAGFAALDKVDNAQMIHLQRSFIAELVPGLDDSTHAPKQTWLTDPVYNGARAVVQEARGVHSALYSGMPAMRVLPQPQDQPLRRHPGDAEPRSDARRHQQVSVR